MSTEEQSGMDEGFSRSGQFAAGASAWAGGLVLALIAGWHLQSPVPMAPIQATTAVETNTPAESPSVGCDVAPDPTADSESTDSFEAPTTFYPEDTIVAARPTGGVTEMQGQ